MESSKIILLKLPRYICVFSVMFRLCEIACCADVGAVCFSFTCGLFASPQALAVPHFFDPFRTLRRDKGRVPIAIAWKDKEPG